MSLLLDAIKSTISQEVYNYPVSCVATGAHMTMLKSQRLGTCMTLSDDRVFEFKEHLPVSNLGEIETLGLEKILSWTDSLQGIERSFGVAAVNASIPLKGKKYFLGNALELAASLGKNKIVSTVGHFPHTEAIKQSASEFYVLEKRPQEGDYPAEEAVNIIPKSDVVAITGVTCLNDTLEGLLKFKKPGSTIIIVGPSVPLSPALFDFGVDIIGGAWVEDEPDVYKKILQGASPRNMKESMRTVLYPKDPNILYGFEEISPIIRKAIK
ncbi:MAG: Rossmann-like domain-containing protein [Candidatus Ozemobacteraceae bacterium]|jgi:uncharacterized protein (DUF4213/DUF364 family)|nr:DUF364 domain-containing protein [Candidatus Riflebacteria bacterium]